MNATCGGKGYDYKNRCNVFSHSFLRCRLPLRLRNPPLPISSSALRSTSSSTEAPPEEYRGNVGICLINSSKKIFVASRLDILNAWQMPQGGVDEGEEPISAVIRELKKKWESDPQRLLLKFLLKLTGSEEEINLLGDRSRTEKVEFGEWSCMSPEQVVEHAVDFKKPVYKDMLMVFRPHLE